MKRQAFIPAVIIPLLFLTGCTIIPKADTVIGVNSSNSCINRLNIGFRDARWSQADKKIIVVCRGWREGEDKTQTFLGNEPNSVYEPHYIRLTSLDNEPNQTFKMELILSPAYFINCKDFNGSKENAVYQGTIKLESEKKLGKLIFNLQNTVLERADKNDEKVILSGKISAAKTSIEKIHSLSSTFESKQSGK